MRTEEIMGIVAETWLTAAGTCGRLAGTCGDLAGTCGDLAMTWLRRGKYEHCT
jgi:hypothetical protein